MGNDQQRPPLDISQGDWVENFGDVFIGNTLIASVYTNDTGCIEDNARVMAAAPKLLAFVQALAHVGMPRAIELLNELNLYGSSGPSEPPLENAEQPPPF